MKKKQAHIFNKEALGHYVEPAWCSERLFEVEIFRGTIWDPACGWGTITSSAFDAGYNVIGTDIVNRKRHKLGSGFARQDFLEEGYLGACDRSKGAFSVVTNPPFDYCEEFARKAYELGAQKIAMIMLVRRLNAAHWMCELPLQKILLFTPRPSMPPGSWIAAGHKPGGGTQDFCWCIWQRGYKGAPTLGWLNRDG